MRFLVSGIIVVAGLLWTRAPASMAQLFPADPLFGQQGYFAAISAQAAWQIEQGHPDVVIAVVSTGIDAQHRDLEGNLWRNARLPEPGCGLGAYGCNFASSEPAPISRDCTPSARAPLPNPDVRDDLGLGTYLAGIAAAVTGNGFGIAGAAWNARVMSVKVSHCGVSMPGAQAAGINYAVRQGARVVLLDGTSDAPAGGCLVYPPAVAEAVQAATTAGVLVVAPAGDGGSACAQRPAALPGAIIVSAAETTPFSVGRAPFNQARPDITLAAPGTNILGPAPQGNCRFCDATGFRSGSSTAAAAALTAGVSALVLSRNPALGPADVRDLLARTAGGPISGQDWAGGGLLSAGRAVEFVPGSYSGRVQRNGQDIAEEIPVSALVGDSRCAEGTTRVVNGVTVVTVHVPPEALRPGCGVPGAPVTLRIGNAIATLPGWRPGVQSVVIDLAAPNAAPPAPAPTPAPQPAEALPSPEGLAGLVSASGAQIVRAVLTTSVSEDLAQHGPPQQVFSAPDQQVILWTEWGGTPAGRAIFFRWGRPNGTIYREGETRSECPCLAISRWQLDWPGPNGGDRMIDSPGVWQIDIYVDGEFIGAVQFRLVAGP